jgi:hypothetical protein
MPDEKFHVQKSTDGVSVLALLENSLAASAASVNETAQIRFGFGGNNDVARIVAGKIGDYTSGPEEDSHLSLYADQDGAAVEVARFNGIRQNLLVHHDYSTDGNLSSSAHGISVQSNNKLSTMSFTTEWDVASASADFFGTIYSGANASAGFRVFGRSIRGDFTSPTSTQANDVLVDISGGGYTDAIINSRAMIQMIATSNWTASSSESHLRFVTTPSGTTSLRDSMFLRSGGIIEVDAAADGDVIRIKQGGTQEGAITVSGTTVAYTTFMGAHPTQLRAGQAQPPRGGVVVSTGEIINPDLTVDGDDQPLPKIERTSRVKRPLNKFDADAFRFTRIDGTTKSEDVRAYGVYVGKNSDNTYEKSFGADDEAEHLVASLGLYMIRVTDTNGNISNGDYLTTSARMFESQRQSDDILHSFTVAKALADVDWSTVPVDPVLGYKWKLIPATIHCG